MAEGSTVGEGLAGGATDGIEGDEVGGVGGVGGAGEQATTTAVRQTNRMERIATGTPTVGRMLRSPVSGSGLGYGSDRPRGSSSGR